LFEEYYQEITLKYDKLNYNYIGINRKEYPKWGGWKIINKYKEQGVDIKEIQDDTLEELVRNFYYLKYLQQQIEIEIDME
jgi:hypothetical protein